MSRSCDCSGGGAETPSLSECQEMYCDAATLEWNEVKCGRGVFLNVWIKERGFIFYFFGNIYIRKCCKHTGRNVVFFPFPFSSVVWVKQREVLPQGLVQKNGSMTGRRHDVLETTGHSVTGSTN